MTTHSSILAWRIPWTEGPGGLQSISSQRVGHILAAFNIYFWCLLFLVGLICVFACFSLGLSGMSVSGLPGHGCLFLPHFREVFYYNLLKYFLSVPFSWDSYDLNVWALNLVLEVS